MVDNYFPVDDGPWFGWGLKCGCLSFFALLCVEVGKKMSFQLSYVRTLESSRALGNRCKVDFLQTFRLRSGGAVKNTRVPLP